MFLPDTWFDGRRRDLRILGGEPVDASGPEPGEEVLAGGTLTRPLAEPHVHLDAALLGARAPNRSGTLREGIANWAALRDGVSAGDVRARALEVLSWYVAYGADRVRTHVDTGCPVAVDALLDLREELRVRPLGGRRVTLEVVAFPQEGILRAPGRREAWEDAVRRGCDAVGAIPHFERTTEEGWASVRLAFDLAEKHGCKLDFHCDETDDPGSRNLEVVCAQALDRGWKEGIVCGHATALHSYPNPHAAKVCELVASAGVVIVANPLDNVVLQGRYDTYPKRRGLTRVDELWRAGARVAFGHDSVVDPWYRLGTANLLDAAYMAAHLGHLFAEEQLVRCFTTLSTENHLPFGPPRGWLWWSAADPVEALRLRAAPRWVG